MDDQKTMVVSVHAKDCVDYQCRRCGQCCRHIKDAVMVESMDAYRLANYLRGCDPNICTIDDVLTRYCEPMPLTQECFPIFMLKTTGPDIIIQHQRQVLLGLQSRQQENWLQGILMLMQLHRALLILI